MKTNIDILKAFDSNEKDSLSRSIFFNTLAKQGIDQGDPRLKDIIPQIWWIKDQSASTAGFESG